MKCVIIDSGDNLAVNEMDIKNALDNFFLSKSNSFC